MRITHLGHSCLLVETGDKRVLIDPGTFSAGFEGLLDLDAIVVTHQHPDHLDQGRLPGLLTANPRARLLVEPETVQQLASGADDPQRSGAPEAMTSGEPVDLGGVTLTPVGDRHAVIHEFTPRIGNLGVLLSADREPTLFHPGDAYDAEPGAVDILALPLTAPWAKVSETLAFVRRIAPRIAIPIHDAGLSPEGRPIYLRHVTQFAPEGTSVEDLSDGMPRDFA